ncbi:MAG: hypothetical protein HQL87_04545 [Magnetococcales bacterium]|nr:hypothetical protein [Magnetococcales bacterium]
MANDAFSVDWMQGWTELQRKIWNDWIAMAGEHMQPNRGFSGVPGMDGAAQWPMQWLQQVMGGGSSGGGASPWAMPWMRQNTQTNPMEEWTRSLGAFFPGVAGPEKNVMNNMMSAAGGFVQMSKEIFQTLQKMGEGLQGGTDWTKGLDQAIQQAKSLFMGQGDMAAVMNPLAAWSQPLQAWTNMLKDNPMFSSLSSGMASNPVLQAIMGGEQAFPWQQGAGAEWMQQMLAIPGLGLTREKQERMQAGMRDLLAYQKASQEFQTLSNQVNVKALDLLHKKLLERGASNTPIETMRELYVLWVDCSEEVNAAFVRGQEYQEANSRMVNAMVRVQNYVQTSVDGMLATFNMPTRKELDSAHRQVHDLKRRVQRLEDQAKTLTAQDHSAELRSIRDDLDRLDVRNLRQELADMKALLESTQSDAHGHQEKKTAAAKARPVTQEKGGPAPVATDAKKGE